MLLSMQVLILSLCGLIQMVSCIQDPPMTASEWSREDAVSGDDTKEPLFIHRKHSIATSVATEEGSSVGAAESDVSEPTEESALEPTVESPLESTVESALEPTVLENTLVSSQQESLLNTCCQTNLNETSICVICCEELTSLEKYGKYYLCQDDRHQLHESCHQEYTKSVGITKASCPHCRSPAIIQINAYILFQLARSRDVTLVVKMFEQSVHFTAREHRFFKNILHSRDETGSTLLHVVIDANSLIMFNLLLDHDINLDITDRRGRTALMLASKLQRSLFAKILIHRGAALDVRDRKGMTALMYAIHNHAMDIVPFLLQSGANPGILDNDHNTILHYAARLADDTFLKLFMKKGPLIELVHFQNSRGETPLMMAVKYSSFPCLRYLMNKGANIHVKDYKQRTALMLAMIARSQRITEYLLRKGAKMQDVDSQGKTALMYAASQPTPLFFARLAKKYKKLMDIRSYDGSSALMEAVKAGMLANTETLIKMGASVEDTTTQKQTLLMCAAESGNIDVVGYLFEDVYHCNEAIVDLYDCEGRTALSFALMYNHLPVAGYLIRKAHANPHFINPIHGNNLLFYAVASHQYSAIDFVLKWHVDPHIRNHQNESAFEMAVASAPPHVAHYLASRIFL